MGRTKENEYEAVYILFSLFPYFNELTKYVNEKMFYNRTWYNVMPDHELGSINFYLEPITYEFANTVMVPWLSKWSNRSRRKDPWYRRARDPYFVFYEKDMSNLSDARLVIPLNEPEVSALRHPFETSTNKLIRVTCHDTIPYEETTVTWVHL